MGMALLCRRLQTVTTRFLPIHFSVSNFSRINMSTTNGNSGKVTIGTHNGSFHCDETLACSLLKLLPRYSEAEIVRTRDLAVLDTCTLVVDVGGVFDKEKNRFDHHQKTFSHTMNSLDPKNKWVTKLSSAGLVYCYFGKEIIAHLLGAKVEDKLVEKVFDKVYENFVEEIDAIDNGISTHDGEGRYGISTNLSSRVSHLGPNWNDANQDFDVGFYKAMELTRTEFMDRVNYYGKVWWAARDIVNKSIQDRFKVHKSGKVLEFEQGGVPWKEHLFELEKENDLSGGDSVLYVIYTDQNGMWRIQCVPLRPKSFENRLSLPEAWRGVRDQDLEKASGIEGATFVQFWWVYWW
eukprot:TRINITY_DN8177_c0_g1_i1.p1 TRINITY_DN8177_c0_g1~~TRINITY_DN8177_c0_g1_i1.p1  ORF type:complete len:394 (-),score=111.95 TRINITY_DN8177_c0_g1_i1:137-1186(-)